MATPGSEPQPSEPPYIKKKRPVDLAFAIDCTGSMGNYITEAQQSVRKIAEEIIKKEQADLHLALVEYRDHPPQDTTFITRELDFTGSWKEMKERLDQCEANGGGDTPEAVADALHAVLKLSWRTGATKICVFIADAPPHGLNCSGDTFSDGCPSGLDPMRTANELLAKGVVVYTVGCEPSILEYRDWFMAISVITGGQYVPLGSAQLLAQVIIAGTSEEVSLHGFMADVNAEVQRLAATNPSLSKQEIDSRVFEKLRGSVTKQLRSNIGELIAPTAQAKKLAELKSLEEVRRVFKPTSGEQIAVLGALRISAPPPPGAAAAAVLGSGSAPSVTAEAAATRYETVEGEITESQVSRMVHRTFNSGLFLGSSGAVFEKTPKPS